MADLSKVASNSNSGNASTIAVTKPTGTTTGDFTIIIVSRGGDSNNPTSTPSGFTALGTKRDVTALDYFRVFAGYSTSSSYSFTWSNYANTHLTAITYRDGFNTSDPIDSVADTVYDSNTATLRASTVSALEGQGVIFAGAAAPGQSRTVTQPTSPQSFSEDFDANTGNPGYLLNTASHATLSDDYSGDLDGTLSGSTASKHAIAIVLKLPVVTVDIPAIAGVTAPVAGATLDTWYDGNAQVVSRPITWSPDHGTAQPGTVYTATLVMEAAEGYTFTGVAADFFTISGATCENAANSGTVTAEFPATAASTITTLAVPGVTVPVAGVAPDTTVTETSQYTGSVSWSPSTNPHPAGTVCTATITLVAKTGYTLLGILEDSFTVSGATSVSNSANSGVITAEFPATAATVTDLSIGGVTAPVRGETPVSTITGEAQFTGTVSWTPIPTDDVFQPGIEYTANITRTPSSGWTFYQFAANSATVAGATTTNLANSGSVAAVFPATSYDHITISAIAGVTPPEVNATPVTAITPNAEYSGVCTWTPSNVKFRPGVVYSVEIVLTPEEGYLFDDVTEDFFTVYGASATNEAGSGVVTAVFPATNEGTYGRPAFFFQGI